MPPSCPVVSVRPDLGSHILLMFVQEKNDRNLSKLNSTRVAGPGRHRSGPPRAAVVQRTLPDFLLGLMH